MIEIKGGKLVFKYFYYGDGRRGSEDFAPGSRPMRGSQLRRYDEWAHGIQRRSARTKNRDACTEEKRKTCDQTKGDLCTGDCPDGDVE